MFNRAFKNNVRPIEIGRRLIREIDSNRTVNSQGQRVVPHHFLVSLAPADHEVLSPFADALTAELVAAAEQYCRDEGYTLRSAVRVEMTQDPDLPRGRIAIVADDAPGLPSAPAPEPRPATPATLVQPAVPPAVAPLGAALAISDGRRFPLGDAPVVIGRLSECDISIDDPNISRRHATITVLDGTYRITDLGSTNGTKVNGTRIASQYELAHGDEITIGLFSLVFEVL